MFVSSITCHITQLKGSDLTTPVAVFGNPDQSNLADWVPILTALQPAAQVK